MYILEMQENFPDFFIFFTAETILMRKQATHRGPEQ